MELHDIENEHCLTIAFISDIDEKKKEVLVRPLLADLNVFFECLFHF